MNNQSQQHSRVIGYILSIIGSISYAATGPLIKYLLDIHHVPALTIAFWRDALIGLTCIIAIVLFKPALLRIERRDWVKFALVGVIGIGLFHTMWVYSVKLNGAALATVLLNVNPSFVALGTFLIFREHISKLHVLALVIASVGCLFAVRAYDPSTWQASLPGTLVGLGSALALAGYVLFNQRIVKTHNPWSSLGITMSFGALTLLILTMIVESPSGIIAVGTTFQPWVILALLALLPTLLGYSALISSLRFIPARVVMLIYLLEIPSAALIAFLWLGEQLQWLQIVGMGLILFSAALPALEKPNLYPQDSAAELETDAEIEAEMVGHV